MYSLKNNIKIIPFVLLLSVLNFLLFHYPFYKFVFNNLDYKSLNGINIVITLMILMVVANAFAFFLVFFLSRFVGKFLSVVFFIVNAIALYFVNTYHIIIDEAMVGNVLNTDHAEATSFFRLN